MAREVAEAEATPDDTTGETCVFHPERGGDTETTTTNRDELPSWVESTFPPLTATRERVGHSGTNSKPPFVIRFLVFTEFSLDLKP